MGFLSDIGGFIMDPLYFVISAVLLGWHKVFGAVFGTDSGASWALSIIGLTVVIRAALIPLFVRQIKSSRNMQLLQPKVKELQKKYGHDRERLTQETMALYRETGTNPFSSCLPLIIQMPIFLALFRLLNAAAHDKAKGLLTTADVASLSGAKIFGGHIADSFTTSGAPTNVKILAAFLVIAMTATTFLTQRQLMSKNMPADALSGPYAQQQKLLLYVLPVVFAVGGIAFPIGVLLYWTTSNLWTMGQQFYVIRNNPAPNTEAFRAKEKRDAEKARRKGIDPAAAAAAGDVAVEDDADDRRPAPRQQPKKQSRQQRKGGGPRPQQQNPKQKQGDDE
ncbi:MAG: membrane protein insertase YidC [Nocardioidaceae bacterium]|nr:membrane protein insertase YidC [Nocardioidaceae bacterium]